VKQNIMDGVADEIRKRMAGVSEFLHGEFKNTKPFRKQPATRQEQERLYYSLTPRQIISSLGKHSDYYTQRIQEIRQQFPNIPLEQIKSPEELAKEDLNDFLKEQYRLFEEGGYRRKE